MTGWDKYYVEMCNYVSIKSKDHSTRVGAVIVGQDNEILSTGFNGFPRGIDDNCEKYHERPLKYLITEHAERNAIYNAARQGIRLKGSTLYLPFHPIPCADCARGIIQSGICTIIGADIPFPGKGEHWENNLFVATEMLSEAGITCITLVE